MKYLKTYENYDQHPKLKEFGEKLKKFTKDVGIKCRIKFEDENYENFACVELKFKDTKYKLDFVDNNHSMSIGHYYDTTELSDYIETLLKDKGVDDIDDYLSYETFDYVCSKLNKDDYEFWLNTKKYNL